MELTPRKKAILAAIVKYHIATGEPVGSKQLMQLIEGSPSSATLRNEMSDLCEAGFLAQPHTSAGRIPTSMGYSFYVDRLMKEDDLPESTKQLIDETLSAAAADTEGLPEVAARLLSRITGLPVVSATVATESSEIKQARLIPVTSKMFMLAVITTDGRTRTKMCRSVHPLENGLLEQFDSVIRKEVQGKKLSSFTPAVLQNLMAASGINALKLAPLFNLLFEMIHSVADSSLDINGESNLFSMLGEEDKAKRLLSFIERKDGMLSLLNGIHQPLSVVFGKDTAFSELNPSAVIVASYGVGDKPLGRIGVIGPTRMSYDKIIPGIEYTAKVLTDLMTDSLKDMED